MYLENGHGYSSSGGGLLQKCRRCLYRLFKVFHRALRVSGYNLSCWSLRRTAWHFSPLLGARLAKQTNGFLHSSNGNSKHRDSSEACGHCLKERSWPFLRPTTKTPSRILMPTTRLRQVSQPCSSSNKTCSSLAESSWERLMAWPDPQIQAWSRALRRSTLHHRDEQHIASALTLASRQRL